MKINPRRPLDDDNPSGYLESDKDFVKNNFEACVAYLEQNDSLRATIKEALEDDDRRFKAYGGAAIRMSQSVRVRLEAAIEKG